MKMSLSSFVGQVSLEAKASRQLDFGFRSPDALPRKFIDGLLAYQIPAVFYNAKSISKFGSAVDASDTGTGKTYTAAAVARILGLKPFVVCPKTVIPDWLHVLKKFKLEVHGVMGYEKLRAGNTPFLKWNKKDEDFVWNLPNDVLLIIDEAHRCKAQDSQNSKMMVAARRQGLYMLPMSATLATTPLEMRAVGYVLGLHNLTNYFKWARDHGAETNEWGGLSFDAQDARNKAILFSLHKQIFPARGYRVRIDELGDQFPETQISTLAVGLNGSTAKLNKVYDEMFEAIANLNDRVANYGSSRFAIMLEARQRAELLKAPAYEELALDALEDRHSVCLFVNFTPTLDLLIERLSKKKGLGISRIDGSQKGDERELSIAEFQANRNRVIVCNIQAGGTGTNLHDLSGDHPRFSIISPNYSAVQLKQVFGRPWRQGGKSKSIQKIVFAAETIEEQACEAVRRKIGNLNLLNDGDLTAGINF